MNNDAFTFQFENDRNEKIDCELILSFYVKDIDKNFLLFTDYTKDKDGNFNLYPYYEQDGNNLLPVNDKEELNLVNTVYKTAKISIKE